VADAAVTPGLSQLGFGRSGRVRLDSCSGGARLIHQALSVLEDPRGRAAEPVSEPRDDADGRLAFASLDASDVVAVDVRAEAQLLLRDAALRANSADRFSYRVE